MSNIDELNYLAVGKNGAYADTGRYQSNPDQVVKISKHIADNAIQELNIYFHGGLVPESSAEESIKRVMAALDKRGVANAHNLGFIWKTDLLTTLKDNISDIFGSKFGKSLLKWVIRAVSKKLRVDSTKSGGVGQGLSIEEIEEAMNEAVHNNTPILAGLTMDFGRKAKGPGNDIDEGDFELITQVAAEIKEAYGSDDAPFDTWGSLPERVSADPELVDIFQAQASKSKGLFSAAKIAIAVVKVAARVIKRYIKDTDHGLHATIVEEICRAYFISDIGQWAWGEMKAKGAEMWQADSKVGFDFMHQLQQLSPGITVNLIGHSAGSVCIARLLQEKRAQQWNITINKIVWWAPACTCELFKDAIIDHEEDFNDFRMYTMDDSFERNDDLINGQSWLYPSSLLYFISGALESKADYPIAGMTRFHSAQTPHSSPLFHRIKEFVAPAGRRILSETPSGALPGYRSQAIDHGAFNYDEETLDSLTEYLR